MGELRIRLLGGLDVAGLPAHEVGSRKGRTLLSALALARGRPVSTDGLVDAVWPGRLPTRPADQLGVLVSRLRGVLGADRLARTGGGYVLDVDWLDVAEVEARVAEAAARLAAHAPAAARAAAAAALALVRGPLLPDDEGSWVETERAAIERLVAQAHFLGAEAALVSGDHVTAASGAARALDHDPYDEAALRVLMHAHVAGGRPASALDVYARTRARLADDLGTSPAVATEELHTAILQGRLDPAGAPGSTGPSGSPAPAPGGPHGALVGRAAELAWLDAHAERARQGQPALVIVEGEAGIGKTALVRGWTAGVTSALVLAGACDQLGRDLPLQPVLDALDRHLAALPPAEVDALLGPQRALVGPLLARAGGNGDLADGGPAAPPAGRPTELPDAASVRAALLAALLAVVERTAAGRPLVLVVDDVHLTGEVTLAWLRYAVRQGGRILVVATRRPGAGPALADGSGRDTLDLGPLDLAATETLVGADRAAALHDRSGGHPLFLLALAGAAAAAPAPAPGAGPGAAGGLPATIVDAVAQQVAALGPASSSLRSAAALGPQVDVALLADVLDRPPAALLDDLEQALRSRILVERADGFAFVHELVREAMAGSLSAPRRALLHRQAARALAARPTAAVEPLAVAHHARLGGDAVLAAEALQRAAALAGDRSDPGAAVELLDEAVALADGAAVRLARARARLALRDFGAAADDADAAVAAGAGVEGFELAGWISYYRRDILAALRYADEGAARTDDPALRASCLCLAGRVRQSQGELAAAETALAEASTVAPVALRSLAAIWLGSLRAHQARPAEAADLTERGLLDRGRLAHPFALPHALATRCYAAGMAGQVGGALAASAELLRITGDQPGSPGARYTPMACNYRAWVLRNLGRTGEAAELNERARSLTAGVGLEEAHNQATLDLADGCLRDGDPDGARRYLAELRGIDHDGPDTVSMAWHQRERRGLVGARLALAEGRAAEAEHQAGETAAGAAARGNLRHATLGLVVQALARLDAGEPPDADAIAALLARLDEVAALEAWRWSAAFADRRPTDALRAATRHRAARLLTATPTAARSPLAALLTPWLP
ncbi:MAG TPA: BTAD domain-containing putative transcriptional regulator [Acidimicrobiales bacterium]|nr:BTAD domain-containing putative transcriptional regulator [Acidimicrobiales bacterium]